MNAKKCKKYVCVCGEASAFKIGVQRKNKNGAETFFFKSPKARF